MQKELTRGKLAKKLGCNVETIRFYEQKGLLLEPKRTQNGYRIYSEEDIKRLNFILKCKNLGFSIKETKALLSLVDNNEYSCDDINEITKIHIKDIENKISALNIMLQELKTISKNCKLGKGKDCSIIDALFTNKYC